MFVIRMFLFAIFAVIRCCSWLCTSKH